MPGTTVLLTGVYRACVCGSSLYSLHGPKELATGARTYLKAGDPNSVVVAHTL